MTEENSHPDIDPLNDSVETARAKRAEQRVGVAGAGVPVSEVGRIAPYTKRIDSAYGDFLFSSAGSLSKPAWSDSMGGRAAIRILSRGVLGAAFFALGGRIARKQLQNYNPETFELKNAEPLEVIAKGFDTVFGKPIAAATRTVARMGGMNRLQAEQAAWNAVNFRTKSYYHDTPGLLNTAGNPMNGRSLGAEMVAISFDFAMMSVGDALVRNFVQMIDPNIKKSWIVNAQGKTAEEGEQSHFSFRKWAESTGKAGWRIFSKNQGEDWAVALAYVYQMKMQRGLISKFAGDKSKGFKVVLDNGWNGGAYKVNNEGKIIGDYQLLGALDLHCRFVGYNVYTLIFREAYDSINHKFKKWREDGFPLHPHMPEHIDVDNWARKATRYVIKSTIKANMYMQPAVIPFWLMRSPQTKWRGGFINTQAAEGISSLISKESFDAQIKKAAVQQSHVVVEAAHLDNAHVNVQHGLEAAADAMRARMVANKDATLILNYGTMGNRVMPGGPTAVGHDKTVYSGNTAIDHPIAPYKDEFDPAIYKNPDFEKGIAGKFGEALNPIGRFSKRAGDKVYAFVDKHLPHGKFRDYLSVNESTGTSDKVGLETFMRNMTDASLAYTPYFYAKTEFGLRVDDRQSAGGLGNMDKAIYKFMDKTAALDIRGMGKSIKEMWHLSTTINKDPISREGGLSEAEKKAKAMAIATVKEVPATTVKAATVQKPVELARDPVAEAQGIIDQGTPHHTRVTVPKELLQDGTPETLDAPQKEKKNDRRWAESVTGRNLGAHYTESPAHIRH